MSSGEIVATAVGFLGVFLSVSQWFDPDGTRLGRVASGADETTEEASFTLVRAGAFGRMYVAGFFLLLAWGDTFERLYTVSVRLFLEFAP